MSNRPFTAKYPGRCAACPDPIDVGDLLTYDTDDLVVHADCRDNPSSLRPPPEICPRCFLAKAASGACGCEEST